jgi:hypothetical protein
MQFPTPILVAAIAGCALVFTIVSGLISAAFYFAFIRSDVNHLKQSVAELWQENAKINPSLIEFRLNEMSLRLTEIEALLRQALKDK